MASNKSRSRQVTGRKSCYESLLGKRPERGHPYPFSEFKREYSKRGKLICIMCNGEGKTYREEDRDYMEGYKLAQKKPCLHCDGTGVGDVKEFRQWYSECEKEYRSRLDRYMRIKRVLSKLNTKDLVLLDDNGFRMRFY